MTSVNDKRIHRGKRRQPCEDGGETRVMWPQVEEHLKPPDAGGGEKQDLP